MILCHFFKKNQMHESAANWVSCIFIAIMQYEKLGEDGGRRREENQSVWDGIFPAGERLTEIWNLKDTSTAEVNWTHLHLKKIYESTVSTFHQLN